MNQAVPVEGGWKVERWEDGELVAWFIGPDLAEALAWCDE